MKNRDVLVRKCISCYKRKNKDKLIRVCRSKDNSVIVDLTYKKEGRGAYICKDNENCLLNSIKHNKITRSLKVEIPSEVICELKRVVKKINY